MDFVTEYTAVALLTMSYMFKNGFRLVIPYIDKLKCRVKGEWVGRDAREVLLQLSPIKSYVTYRSQLIRPHTWLLISDLPSLCNQAQKYAN